MFFIIIIVIIILYIIIYLFVFIIDFKKSELFETLKEFKSDLKEQMKQVPVSKMKKMTKSSISTKERYSFPPLSNQVFSHEGYMVTRKRTNEWCGGGVRSMSGMSITILTSMMSGSSDPCIEMALGGEPPSRKLGGHEGGHEGESMQVHGMAVCSNIKKGAEGLHGPYMQDTTEMGLLMSLGDKCNHPYECNFDEGGNCMYMPMEEMQVPKCRPYGPKMNKSFGTTCSDKPDYYHQIQGYFKQGAMLMKAYMHQDECMHDLDQASYFSIMPAPNKCERSEPEGCPEGVGECFMKFGCDSETQEMKIGFWNDDKWCKGRPDNVHSMDFQGMYLFYYYLYQLFYYFYLQYHNII
jgi:hypothetical protein